MAAKKKVDASPADTSSKERARTASQRGGRATRSRVTTRTSTPQAQEVPDQAQQPQTPPEPQRPQSQHPQQTQQGQARARGQQDQQDGAVQPSDQQQPVPPFPAQHQDRPGIEAQIEPRPEYSAPTYAAAGKLQGKVALITGGDSGIGRAVAVLYAREGADVSIVYLPQEQVDAEETRSAVEAEGRRALLIPGDVTDPQFCRDAVEQSVRELGKLDILVNNAAYQQSQESLEDVSEEQWDRTFRTNIYGYFYMAKAALPHLKQGSAIVNCGSITGLQGSKSLLDYSATKGAINAFTKSLAQNLVEREIRVNCVAPGPVWTPLNIADKPPEKAGKHGQDVPMKRPAQPEEVAPAFVFFASEADSSYITGEVLTLLGGETTAA
ncbi:MAG TPA: SDR family oxidoreductase [Gemmatimonadales bacterium]|nr:SDR family oxidoreductase [Gemmatimonadales bacterium]